MVQLYLLQASLIGKSQSILDFPRKMGPYERNPVFPIYANTAQASIFHWISLENKKTFFLHFSIQADMHVRHVEMWLKKKKRERDLKGCKGLRLIT